MPHVDQTTRPLSWGIAMRGATVAPPTPAESFKLVVELGCKRASSTGEHYDRWEEALAEANVMASRSKEKTLVVRCRAHGRWTVWQLNEPITGVGVLACTQCGQPYSARACGPTHALVWHQMEQEVLELG